MASARYPTPYQTPMPTGGSVGRMDRTALVEYDAIPEEIPKGSGEYETSKGLTDDRWLISVKDGQVSFILPLISLPYGAECQAGPRNVSRGLNGSPLIKDA